jgi:hypothetical protein
MTMANDQTERCLSAAVAIAAENVVLRDRVGRLEEQNRELESELMHFTNLYVASLRLHENLEPGAVLQAMQEIMINLVGTEEIAIFELAANAAQLSLLSCFGVARERLAHLPLDAGAIGNVAATGEAFFAGASAEGDGELTACVPLRADGRVIGVIAVFRLLPQKQGIERLDRELFELLATHGAHALWVARAGAR